MPFKPLRFGVYLAISLIALSLCVITINHFIYHFPGNEYFPHEVLILSLSLGLMYTGCTIMFSHDHPITERVLYFIYFLGVMSVLALATNAVQYTPFTTIDKYIVSAESLIQIHEDGIATWTHQWPRFYSLLTFIYNSLPYQMCYIPLFIIICRKKGLIAEYFCLLLISALLGFSIYYFFPTTGPASVFGGPSFTEAQYATGLKFSQIHHHMQPSTLDGGLIALPSFHVIWSWFCLYLLNPWKWLFLMMLPINGLLIISCVLLGWHYPTDILAAAIVILLSHWIYYTFNKA